MKEKNDFWRKNYGIVRRHHDGSGFLSTTLFQSLIIICKGVRKWIVQDALMRVYRGLQWTNRLLEFNEQEIDAFSFTK